MRIAIVGGSVGGLFAAALLRRTGHDVEVFERSNHGLEGRGAGLVAQSDVYRLLQIIGRDDVAETGVEASARIILVRSGAVLRRDPRPQIQISWDSLYLAVRSLMPEGAYHLGKLVDRASDTGKRAWLRFEDGSDTEADLIVGADGIGSIVRQAVLGGASPPRYAGYVAWRFLIPESRLTALATEILTERFAFYFGEGSQTLGYLVAGSDGSTLPGRRRYNCVWYRRAPDLNQVLRDKDGRRHNYSLAPGQVPEAVRNRLVEDAEALLPPPFVDVIKSEPNPFVQAIFDMDSLTMVAGRLVLLGDAAFVVRPHTAMGVAKAAGDAMALAEAISAASLEEGLAAYDSARRWTGKMIGDYGRRLGAQMVERGQSNRMDDDHVA